MNCNVINRHHNINQTKVSQVFDRLEACYIELTIIKAMLGKLRKFFGLRNGTGTKRKFSVVKYMNRSGLESRSDFGWRISSNFGCSEVPKHPSCRYNPFLV